MPSYTFKTWTNNDWLYSLDNGGGASGGFAGVNVGDVLHVTGTGTGPANGFRPGAYTVTQTAPNYGTLTPDGNQNLIRFAPPLPINDASGNQVQSVSSGVPQISGGTGYIGSPTSVPLVAGTLAFAGRTGTNVTLTESGSSGASGFSKAFHRLPTPGTVPNSATQVGTGTSATNSFTDTPPDNNLYYYCVFYTDSVNPSATGNVVAASLSASPVPTLPAPIVPTPPKIAIIVVGDSNSEYGAFGVAVSHGTTTPIQGDTFAGVAGLLAASDARYDITYLNAGYGGSRIGDWVNPPSGSGIYGNYQAVLSAIAAAVAAGRKPVVLQMLGTNDALTPSGGNNATLDPNTYSATTQQLVAQWVGAGAALVCLIEPGYAKVGGVPVLINSPASLTALIAFSAALRAVAALTPKTLFIGGLYRHLADNQQLFADGGVHFNSAQGRADTSAIAAAPLAAYAQSLTASPVAVQSVKLTRVRNADGTYTLGGKVSPTNAPQAITFTNTSIGSLNGNVLTLPQSLTNQDVLINATVGDTGGQMLFTVPGSKVDNLNLVNPPSVLAAGSAYQLAWSYSGSNLYDALFDFECDSPSGFVASISNSGLISVAGLSTVSYINVDIVFKLDRTRRATTKIWILPSGGTFKAFELDLLAKLIKG